MSGHLQLLNDRDLVARLVPREACFCNEDHTGAAPLGGRPVGAILLLCLCLTKFLLGERKEIKKERRKVNKKKKMFPATFRHITQPCITLKTLRAALHITEILPELC